MSLKAPTIPKPPPPPSVPQLAKAPDETPDRPMGIASLISTSAQGLTRKPSLRKGSLLGSLLA